MKRFLPCALMILIALCPLTALASAPEEDIIELGAFPDAFVSPEGFVPGPGLEWWMPVEDFVETMPHPEQLDPEHPRYTRDTYTLYRGSNGSISPYEKVVFSDIDYPFWINYNFDREHKLQTVWLFAGEYEYDIPEPQATQDWEIFTPIMAQVLQKLYALQGEERTLEELISIVEAGHAAYPGIRAVWEGEGDTIIVVSTEWVSPGVMVTIGPSGVITPNREMERLWLP